MSKKNNFCVLFFPKLIASYLFSYFALVQCKSKVFLYNKSILKLITVRKRSLGQGNFFDKRVCGGGDMHAGGVRQNPPRLLRDTVNKRAVRIPLECILVLSIILHLIARLAQVA